MGERMKVYHYYRALTPELCAKQHEACSAVVLNDGGRYREPFTRYIDTGDDARLSPNKRPGWKQLWETISSNDVAIVSSLDRISRKADEVAEVVADMRKYGIKLIDASMSCWTDAWPTEDGLYWAYGKLHGHGKAKLHRVEVTLNGVPFLIGFGRIHRSENHQLQFQRIPEPKVPCALLT